MMQQCLPRCSSAVHMLAVPGCSNRASDAGSFHSGVLAAACILARLCHPRQGCVRIWPCLCSRGAPDIAFCALLLTMCCTTEQGHQRTGQARADSAAAVVDTVSTACSAHDMLLPCPHVSCRTAQGHKLRDQARVDSAAAIVDTVFHRLLGSEYGPAVAAAHKLRQQGQLGEADQGPAKRQRLANPLLPQQRVFHRAAAAAAAGRGDVDEVITAFMNGEDGFGPSNTQVRRKHRR